MLVVVVVLQVVVVAEDTATLKILQILLRGCVAIGLHHETHFLQRAGFINCLRAKMRHLQGFAASAVKAAGKPDVFPEVLLKDRL